MTQREEIEFNKRCAKFIGWVKLNEDSGMLNWESLYKNNHGDYVSISNMKFHSDWNFIMEVVEKIQNTLVSTDDLIGGGQVLIFNDCCKISPYKHDSKSVFVEIKDNLKKGVTEAIDKFLILYYENNK